MKQKTKQKGTLLYPGVVLRAGHILINQGSAGVKTNSKRQPKTIRKIDLKPTKRKSRKFVNLLIED